MTSLLFWNRRFLLLMLMLIYLTAGSHMTRASVLLKLHGLEDSLFDSSTDHETLKAAAGEGGEGGERRRITTEKRQTAVGTCTCTCETKPSNSTSTSTSSSSSWSAETSAESHRKWPSSAPEAVASSLRTDTSGNRLLNALPVPGAKQQTKSTVNQGAKADDNGLNGLTDVDPADSSQRDWGHGSRFLWKRLPDRMCYREPCLTDNDCCLWYNICDRSAKVCVDCWYGSPCSSERDCCIRYPYCDGESRRTLESGPPGGNAYAIGGQCVDELR